MRQQWMTIMAKAPLEKLEQYWTNLPPLPSYQMLRKPETGLTMVRGRDAVKGLPFNLGEMTITRCVIQLVDDSLRSTEGIPITGFGYVAGRSKRHAELAALGDALLQCPDWFQIVYGKVIDPLKDLAEAQQKARANEVEATRVNFFTMQRGE